MILPVHPTSRAPRSAPRQQAAFTMIEIAMALAIVGFALVAIIGVLPQVVNVQRDNRRETIINQDANFYIDALRGGAQRLDDLTNYVMSITNAWVGYGIDGKTNGLFGYDTYTNVPTDGPISLPLGDARFRVTNPYFKSLNGNKELTDYRITNGLRILGVMSLPRYQMFNDGTSVSNSVVVYARALSGAANEKNPQTNDLLKDIAFSYRFSVQIAPQTSGATNWNNGSFNAQFDSEFGTNAAGTSF
ncbi:MAG: hypothetical protein RLZZ350_1971, partial [Verrucomicrobiota bacterium]